MYVGGRCKPVSHIRTRLQLDYLTEGVRMTMRNVIVWAIFILAAGMWGYAQAPTPQLELHV